MVRRTDGLGDGCQDVWVEAGFPTVLFPEADGVFGVAACTTADTRTVAASQTHAFRTVACEILLLILSLPFRFRAGTQRRSAETFSVATPVLHRADIRDIKQKVAEYSACLSLYNLCDRQHFL
jgi:hypothetical protein